MGEDIPDGVNLPKFVWQKGSPHRKKGGSSKPSKRVTGLALLLFIVLPLSVTTVITVFMAHGYGLI